MERKRIVGSSRKVAALHFNAVLAEGEEVESSLGFV
jgi:hypothetical protein